MTEEERKKFAQLLDENRAAGDLISEIAHTLDCMSSSREAILSTINRIKYMAIRAEGVEHVSARLAMILDIPRLEVSAKEILEHAHMRMAELRAYRQVETQRKAR